MGFVYKMTFKNVRSKFRNSGGADNIIWSGVESFIKGTLLKDHGPNPFLVRYL